MRTTRRLCQAACSRYPAEDDRKLLAHDWHLQARYFPEALALPAKVRPVNPSPIGQRSIPLALGCSKIFCDLAIFHHAHLFRLDDTERNSLPTRYYTNAAWDRKWLLRCLVRPKQARCGTFYATQHQRCQGVRIILVVVKMKGFIEASRLVTTRESFVLGPVTANVFRYLHSLYCCLTIAVNGGQTRPNTRTARLQRIVGRRWHLFYSSGGLCVGYWGAVPPM